MTRHTRAALVSALNPLAWIRKSYDWTVHWARTPKAPFALFSIAFMESSFFPVPPDVLLIAMVVADRKKWLRDASICTAGSVCGAFLGYFIGWGLYETAGKWIVATYHLESAVNFIGIQFEKNAFLAIFTAAFTPIPYKAFTISAGLFHIPLSVLVLASAFGRAGRFFMVAAALRVFGKKIADSIEKYFNIFSVIFILLVIAGIMLIKHGSR
ncbi:MAG: VTT domain-containing protein [Candidatus Omnitrophica bacterium]|nr:VTT domain-containing protein [Candidatus Omnitrophota bacterium]MDD5573594.1 VTT domain-containing protein [Candidatus Omnitrophota bacterium]